MEATSAEGGAPVAAVEATRRRCRRDVTSGESAAPFSRRKNQRREKQATNDVAGENEEESSAKKHTEGAKKHSSFAELRRSLTSAEEVAAFIRSHHDTKLRDIKQVNSFFQAISNQPADLFASLCQQHKREVHLALERLLEMFSSGKVAMLPPVHEFVIRCEQNGVRAAEWAVDLDSDPADATAAATTTPTQSLLLPRELIKKLVRLDPRGRLERMIEMCGSPKDLQTCARKLQAATERDKDMAYAVKCQLVGKLVSKARRTCGAALLAEAPHLPADDAAAVGEMTRTLIAVTESALAARPFSASQHPIAKLAHFAKWCGDRGLLGAGDAAAVAALEGRAHDEAARQAERLEAVVRLKTIEPGSEAAARGAVDELWDDERGHFEPCSADVLSSIAVVAGSSGMSDAFRAQVAERLVKTYRKCLQASGEKLPRRVLNLVNAEQSREKQKSIRKMLADEEGRQNKKMVE